MERQPDLSKDTYLQDVHCVSSLCKAYFRELPNPLLTYQLYDKFADAVAIQLEEQRLIKIKEVLKELPLPHYRTLEYLMRHLLRMASFSSQTNMHARNLAIVWAPNLLRSKDIESSGFNGTAAFMEVRIQSIVVEFILTHVEQLFGDMPLAGGEHCSITKLNSPSCVREDYFRSLTYNIPRSALNQGDGPPQMRPYHTIIEFSDHKRKGSLKAKKWKSIFNLGRSNNDSKRKAHKQDEKDSEKTEKMSLRPAKSMDSLSSVPYASEAMDSDRGLMGNKSPKRLVPLRRESFGANSKPGQDYTISGELSIPLETSHQKDYEEESKSEPTTPKPGRSSIVASPQGRSPKSAQNRAEKCLGVHISEPFSVTLPRHITSNLSRLTRVMECPSLKYPVLYGSSEKISSQEESPPQAMLVPPSTGTQWSNAEQSAMLHDGPVVSEVKLGSLPDVSLSMESDGGLDLNQVKSSANSDRSPVPMQEQSGHRDSELSSEKDQVDPSMEPQHANGKGSPFETTDKLKPDTEKKRISLEVQDTFSFLDNQDTTPESSALDGDGAEEGLPGYHDGWVPGDEELRSAYMTDMITSCMQQREEFSVEPPPEDLSTEDDEDMYSMAAECADTLEDLRHIDDYSDDIYLSAYDDLSPLARELETMYVVEQDSPANKTVLGESSSRNLPGNSNHEVNTETQLELEPPEMQGTINVYLSTEALQDSMGDPSVQDGGSHIPETNATSGRDEPKQDLQQCEGSTEHILKSEDVLQDSLRKARLHLLTLGLDVTQDIQVLKPVPCLDIKTLVLDIQQGHSNYLECSTECDSTRAHNMPLTEWVPPILEHVLLTDTPALEHVLLTDAPASEHVLLTDTPASEHVLLTDSPSLEHVLLTDSPSLEHVLLTDVPASEHVLLTNVPASEYVLLTDTPASGHVLLKDSPSLEHVLLTDTPASYTVDSVQQDEVADHKQNKDLPTCSAQDTGVSMQVTLSEKTNKLIPAVFPDGSVSMKLASAPQKIHQVKSVPVVPPKPQFAKLPPALKSKIHISPANNISKDTESHKSDSVASVEMGNPCSESSQSQKRSSWRSGASVSFDTAVAQARERQMSQYPIRRMQTYCVGESHHVLDNPKEDASLHRQKLAQKPGGSRPHSCVLALNSLEVASKVNSTDEKPKSSHLLQECRCAMRQDTAGARNRRSMPRLAKQTSTEEPSETCEKPQRRSLL
eukprot:XP_002944018.2 PREDICTED: rho GTPase-activating protein 30 [Xenopus tropicalis]